MGFTGGFISGWDVSGNLTSGATGGAVGGFAGGVIQWLGLRRYITKSWDWVLTWVYVGAVTWALATSWAVGKAGNEFVEINKVSVWVSAGVLVGAVNGVISGIWQVRLLRENIPNVSNWLFLVNSVGCAAGGAIFLPTFWSWGIALIGGGNPGAGAKVAIFANDAICKPVFVFLVVMIPIWVIIQTSRHSKREIVS